MTNATPDAEPNLRKEITNPILRVETAALDGANRMVPYKGPPCL
jgi:hypothetical protein